jgi:penicillin-binding protein 1A
LDKKEKSWLRSLLEREINLYKRERVNKSLAVALIISITIIAVLLLLCGIYWYFAHDLPDLTKVTGYKPRLTTEVYSSDGKVIGEFGSEQRELIPYREIPPHVRNAFISAEDKRFFEHRGVDIKRILGALLKNVEEGEIVQGGSTITQQVVKNLALSPERSISRKIKEAILAYRMEKNLSKEEILYIYLNHIYFGDGTYGIEAASRNYFGKSARDINIAEAAFLAAIPKAPTYYYPREHFGRVKSRQELILKLMEDSGFITKEQREKAEEYPIKIVPKRNINIEVAPYFVELVRQYIEARFGTKALVDGGYKVFTTLDADLSLAGEWALRRGILEIESRQGRGIVNRHLNSREEIDSFRESQKVGGIENGRSYQGTVIRVTKGNSSGIFTAIIGIGKYTGKLRFAVSSPLGTAIEGLQVNSSKRYAPLNGYYGVDLLPFKLRVGDVIEVRAEDGERGDHYLSVDYGPESQGALLAMDTNGYVKAMVGGFNFLDTQFNRATEALRQPGSSFKPMVYAAAIDKGYTETTPVYDMPITINGWTPQNYDNEFLGEIPMREALAKSRNLASVRILMDIGPNYAVDYAKRFGFTSHLNPYPTLALGGSDVTLMDMVKAFGVFATGGKLVEPKFILRIYDRDGEIVEDNTVLLLNEEAENAKREMERMEIIRQIAKDEGMSDMEAEIGLKEDALMQRGFFTNKKFLTYQEFLRLLQKGGAQLIPYDTGERVISPETAYIMTDMLQAVIKEGTGQRALELNSLAPVAGKTGTTNDFTDAWFIGFSPRIVAGVWIGRDDHKSIGEGEVGSRAALPVWIDFMREALKRFPGGDFQIPSTIQFISTHYGFVPYKIDSTSCGVDAGNKESSHRDYASKSEIDFLMRN